jgi:hypothetical protein
MITRKTYVAFSFKVRIGLSFWVPACWFVIGWIQRIGVRWLDTDTHDSLPDYFVSATRNPVAG